MFSNILSIIVEALSFSYFAACAWTWRSEHSTAFSAAAATAIAPTTRTSLHSCAGRQGNPGLPPQPPSPDATPIACTRPAWS